MSLVNRLRSGGLPPPTPSGTKGGVSGGLRSKLGEELAAMLEKVGRKVYAAAMERTRKAIAESLLANRPVLAAGLRQEFGRRGATHAKQAIAEWLDEVVGEVLTDVAEEVYKDLPNISDALVEQVAGEDDENPFPPQEEDEEEVVEEDEVEEDPEDEEVPEEEGSVGEYSAEEPGSEELQAIADELEEIKAAGFAQAARLAAAGDSDSAAYCRMVMEQL
jgi:hypothetical protein